MTTKIYCIIYMYVYITKQYNNINPCKKQLRFTLDVVTHNKIVIKYIVQDSSEIFGQYI